MAWREPAASSLDFSDDEEDFGGLLQKENYRSSKLVLSPPRPAMDPYYSVRSPLDDLEDLNVRVGQLSSKRNLYFRPLPVEATRNEASQSTPARSFSQDYCTYRSPSWLNQRTESQLDQFTQLLGEMEAETRALHREWSEHPEEAVAAASAVGASEQAASGASDATIEQRVRSLDLEARLPAPATNIP